MFVIERRIDVELAKAAVLLRQTFVFVEIDKDVGYKKQVLAFEQVVEKTKEELKKEDFGVLTYVEAKVAGRSRYVVFHMGEAIVSRAPSWGDSSPDWHVLGPVWQVYWPD